MTQTHTDNVLEGKVAIVTGATSGIGAATAKKLAAAGAKVVIAGRRAERLADLTHAIQASGGQVLGVVADSSLEAQAHDVVQRALSGFGRVDIVLNNAGAMLLGPLETSQSDEWRRMVDINLMGLLYTTQAALPIFRSQGSGHVINVASLGGHVSFPNVAVYNATKFGVIGLSEALRQEVHHNHIRVTVISPGVVATELWEHSSHPEGQKMASGFIGSMQQPLTSEDIAEAIHYAVTRPAHVNINEILLMPTEQ